MWHDIRLFAANGSDNIIIINIINLILLLNKGIGDDENIFKPFTRQPWYSDNSNHTILLTLSNLLHLIHTNTSLSLHDNFTRITRISHPPITILLSMY